ncbi:unnamed protein product, partial [Adineta ricciae]
MPFLIFTLLIASSLFVCTNAQNTCEPRSGQKDTSLLLASLRQQMQNEGIGVYVIFADDEHGSEYTQPYDKRRDWITGFRGSAGTAVVTLNKAALWTDSRYFTQAEEQLDCANWLLMKDKNPGVPTLIDWLVSEASQATLPPGTTTVFTSTSWWSSASSALKAIGKELRPVDDLVGRIWPANERPVESQNPIVKHDLRYAGEDVRQKLNRVTTEIKRLGATATVISALDEVAWLFNLRGSDIPYNAFFKSYAIVYVDYEESIPELFVNLAQLDPSNRPDFVRVSNISKFLPRLSTIASDSSVGKIWISPRVSQAIYSSIPESKIRMPLANSPVQRVKAKKNAQERKGMQDCQVRDAVVRMKHLGWIEQQLNEGKSINETQSSDQLLVYQQQQDLFQFPSFAAISAAGDRAAVVHYRAEPETAKFITK